ncbi:MAG TPA: OmpA family protein [bacterium]
MSRECDCPPPGAPEWMNTFADMMSLLLTFFVLLLSFANMDIVRFREAMSSIQNALLGGPTAMKEVPQTAVVELSQTSHTSLVQTQREVQENPPSETGEPETAATKVVTSTTDLEALASIEQMLREQELIGMAEAEATARGVIIRVKGQLFFEAGSAELLERSYPMLNEIGAILLAFPYNITVEGHTDDQPIHTERFPSNWELSTARAISVMRYLSERRGVPAARMGVAGYADIHPVVPNDSPEHRAANRRVEFVFHKGEIASQVIDDPLMAPGAM